MASPRRLSCEHVLATVMSMRRILIPIGLILASILLLAAATYWYVQEYGSDGPFPPSGQQ